MVGDLLVVDANIVISLQRKEVIGLQGYEVEDLEVGN
jgi:hypothetical protein